MSATAGKQALRAYVRGMYDAQKLRIMMGNRIAMNFRVSHGQEPGTTEEETMTDEGKDVLTIVRAVYRRICDGLVAETGKTKRVTKSQLSTLEPTREWFQNLASEKVKVGDEEYETLGVISTWAEMLLIQQWLVMEAQEAHMSRKLEAELEPYPIWTQWMKDIRGLGPMMAAVIITEMDPHIARYPSSFWKYCGLDVYQHTDGCYYGRSRRKEALVDQEYTDAEGATQTKKGLGYNPFLKTKLRGVLAGNFIKAKNERYRGIYDAYKHRLESDSLYGVHNDGRLKLGNGTIVSKAKRHEMALRYMIKMFLKDLWNEWRKLEGLSLVPGYDEAKLGIVHGEPYTPVERVKPDSWTVIEKKPRGRKAG